MTTRIQKLLPRHKRAPVTKPGTAKIKPAYEVEIRKNDRGGFEIAMIGEPTGIGNYPTAHDAYATACYSWDREKVKHYQAKP